MGYVLRMQSAFRSRSFLPKMPKSRGQSKSCAVSVCSCICPSDRLSDRSASFLSVCLSRSYTLHVLKCSCWQGGDILQKAISRSAKGTSIFKRATWASTHSIVQEHLHASFLHGARDNVNLWSPRSSRRLDLVLMPSCPNMWSCRR